MARQNTAAEKLVEQMLENIEEAQAINFEKRQTAEESDLDTSEQVVYRTGKDVGMSEAKFQVKRAFEEMIGQEFER